MHLDNGDVVGDDMWAAEQGLGSLKIQWNEGPNAGLSTDEIVRQLEAVSCDGAFARTSDGRGAAADLAAKLGVAVREEGVVG
jgi:isoquinoline 1-oxidoreductase beta subunit